MNHLSLAESIPYDIETGALAGQPVTRRYLSDLAGLVLDEVALQAALKVGNPLVYSVSTWQVAMGEGDLHVGLGILQPGKIGEEYFFTKGHLHAWQPAAEFYLGLAGEGLMLLEDLQSGESRVLPLQPKALVYVPGYVAHRTVNTGSIPLVYLGIYPARAGHDYTAIAGRNFRKVVICRENQPVVMDRIQEVLP